MHRVCEGAACRREVRVTALGEEVTLLPNAGVRFGRFQYDLTQAPAVRSKLATFRIGVTPGNFIICEAQQLGFTVIANNIGSGAVGVSCDSSLALITGCLIEYGPELACPTGPVNFCYWYRISNKIRLYSVLRHLAE